MESPRISFGSLYRWISKLHVYFGLFISPFVVLFAVSAIMFNHTWGGVDSSPKAEFQETSFETVSIEVPENVERLEVARDIMRQVDVSGEIEFLSHEPQRKRFTIPVMKPRERITIKVDLEKKTAEIERRRTGFWNSLLYLHKSPGPHLAGFRGNWFFTKFWMWLADVTVYLFLALSISGIYMWILLKSERKTGLILLGAGCLTFFLIVLLMAS
ncbi:PepSY-associated TM helix domain-containing protein [Candidatus Poribacteria bacterium]